MVAYRVLVVDDHHDARRMLATGLRTLGSEIEVIDVPSGEEALLVASRRPVDLLIVDVRLPGISGFELVGRVHKRYPGLKTILITGLTDPKIRQQVAEADASACFYKPIEMSDFLDTVERCLGLVETFFPLPPAVEPETPVLAAAPVKLADRLANLRQDLKASAILLLNQKGEVSARAGDLPDPDLEIALLLTLTNAVKAEVRVAEVLGMRDAQGLLCITGAQYGLYATHAGLSSVVIAILPHTARVDLGAIGLLLTTFARELQAILVQEGEKSQLLDAEKVFETVQAIEKMEDVPPIDLPEIDAIFGQAPQQAAAPTDLDAFWDSLAEQNAMDNPLIANTITYEQARKLGLAPKEEKKISP